MRFLTKFALLSLSLAAMSGSAPASTFTFSYVFDDAYGYGGSTATGTLSGTQVGNSATGYVTGVSVQSLFVNGIQVPGTIYNAAYTGTGNDFEAPGGAVVSFLQSQNNFLFINSDYGNHDYSYTGYFYNLAPAFYGLSVGVNFDPFTVAQDDGQGAWTLTGTNDRVPDGGATMALLGMAMSGMVWIRRKLK